MSEFTINKGIGRNPEFKGLKSQYLFIFAGGLLSIFIVFVIMYMIGVGQWICIAFGVIAASILVYTTFHLNTKFGEHGLMKLMASRNYPGFITNRRKFSKLFARNIKREAV